MTNTNRIVVQSRRIMDHLTAAEIGRAIEDTRRIRSTLVTDHGKAHACILVAVMRAAVKRKERAEG